MKPLWAPWRMEFICQEKPEGVCIFCEILSESRPSREKLVLHVGKLGCVVMNRYPYGHGHLMVMPIRHVGDLTELSNEENAELSSLLQTCLVVLREAMQPHGFNIGLNLGKAAGAGIEEHLHWHVVPRWFGDINFMALVSEVRSIPEHLAVTYDKLRPLFEKHLGQG